MPSTQASPPSRATASTGAIAVRVEGLGKRYAIGELSPHTDLLSERLGNALRDPLGRRRRKARKGASEEDAGFWALRDVNFELRRGEALGLVGRNGAGKSTLLKILSGISPPTCGTAEIHGRMATLLEVGTGFHPELTGRENVFLNGAILGMRRAEVAARFDEMVEFAAVSRFLDTPVKRYSSGMRVRLAFAVAAHLEPDLLLVDEVLAVGDAEFQRKCLGKMRDVAGEGRAVIFVSHNLSAVQRLCTRAFLIESGRIERDGTPAEVVSDYLNRVEPEQGGGTALIRDDAPRNGTGQTRLRRVRLTDDDGDLITSVFLGQPFRVELTYEVYEALEEATIELGLSSAEGQRVLTAQGVDGDRPPMRLVPGTWTFSARIETTLLPGEFVVDAGLHRMDGNTTDNVERVLRFAALNQSEEGDDSYPWQTVRGYVRPASSEWTAVMDEGPVGPREGSVG